MTIKMIDCSHETINYPLKQRGCNYNTPKVGLSHSKR